MSNINYYSVTKDNFVGIKFSKDNIDIYYPTELDPKIKNDKQLCLDFLRTISYGMRIFDIYEQQYGNNDALFSLQWILMDYVNNGITLSSIKKINENINGTIRWKETLNKSIPYLTNNGVFFSRIYSSRNSYIEDQINKIYRFCLNYSSSKLGWLFDINYSDSIEIDIQKSVVLVNKELSKTFQDNLRIKFKHLLTIIKLVSDEVYSNSLFTFGVNEYHYIYENMLRKTIQNSNLNLSLYYPVGIWEIGGIKYNSSHLRPDFIYESLSETFVFDAKFYRKNMLNLPFGLPTSGDMQKQLTYGDYLKSNITKNIYSAFILPTKSDSLISYFGKSYLKGINVYRHHTIVSLEIDLEMLIKKFLDGGRIKPISFINLVKNNAYHY